MFGLHGVWIELSESAHIHTTDGLDGARPRVPDSKIGSFITRAESVSSHPKTRAVGRLELAAELELGN